MLFTDLSSVREGALRMDDPDWGLGKRERPLNQQIASIRTRENRRGLLRRGSLRGSHIFGSEFSLPTGEQKTPIARVPGVSSCASPSPRHVKRLTTIRGYRDGPRWTLGFETRPGSPCRTDQNSLTLWSPTSCGQIIETTSFRRRLMKSTRGDGRIRRTLSRAKSSTLSPAELFDPTGIGDEAADRREKT